MDELNVAIKTSQRSKNIRNTSVGTLITLTFAGVDTYVLFSMFLGGNMSESMARNNAGIGAFALDLIPYLLGMVLARCSDGAIEKHNKSKYKIALVMLGFIMLIVFSVYIIIRIIIFIGGGDFNVGFQMLAGTLPWGSSFDNINASDAFSALVPLATSFGSLAVGLILYESQEKTILRFLDEAEAEDRKISTKIAQLEGELNAQLAIVWAKFGEGKYRSGNEYEKIRIIAKNYFVNKSTLYEEMYITYSKNIAATAVQAMRSATTHIAEYTAIPDEVLRFTLNDEEKGIVSQLNRVERRVKEKIWEKIEERLEKDEKQK